MEPRMKRLLEEELESTPVPAWLDRYVIDGLRLRRRAAAPRWSHAAFALGVLAVIAAVVWLSPAARHLPPATAPAKGAAVAQSTMAKLPAPLQTLHMTSKSAGWGLAWLSTADSAAVYPQPFHVVRTTDGGRHWQEVGPRGVQATEATAAGGDFPDDRVAWVAISAPADAPRSLVVWSTRNGGRSWSKSVTALPSFPVQALYVRFADPGNGWILAASDPALGLQEKALYRTSDGGRSWNLVSQTGARAGSLPAEGYTTGIAFLDAKTGWLGMQYRSTGPAVLYRTEDGGRTWKPQVLSLPRSATPLYYGDTYPPYSAPGARASLLLPVAISSSAGWQVAVYETGDRGATWRPREAAPTGSGNPPIVSLAGPTDVFVAGDSELLYSGDGGRTWAGRAYPGSLKIALRSGYAVRLLQFTDRDDGWMLLAKEGPVGSGGIRELFRTTDGGRSWSLVGTYSIGP